MPNRVGEILHGALRTLRREGFWRFARRSLLWLSGERRQYRPPDPLVPDSYDAAALSGEGALTALDALAARATNEALIPALPPRRTKYRPKISVLVRTYNRPHMLRLALTSLAMQEYRNFEVVVVNDAGEDVAPLLHRFEAHFPIQYICHPTRQQRCAASNTALRAMRGDYFVHLDDDDILYPFHLATFHNASLTHPAARVLYGDYNHVLLGQRGSVLIPLQRKIVPHWAFDPDALLWSNFIVIHASFFHRDIYEVMGLYDESLPGLADWEYLLRTSRGYPFQPTGRIVCEYRIYDQVSNMNLRRRIDVVDALRIIYERYPTENPDLLEKRRILLSEGEAQVAFLRELEGQIGRGEITEKAANAAMLRRLAGFDGVGDDHLPSA
ncbi:MAG TPA: glycosyltransferase [Aggregatilineales bacterium]|nr:glycosyltransferase [Anaerolineales bacterium]HRE48275.1 glycosyltransferase [Aggregatilineales bacterium]